ncbi:MAG TPA: hypothetical protein DCL17_04060 [Dehalococcoidia bacterium]|nr:hypothetical protein [Dehalococcoidia bacterium]
MWIHLVGLESGFVVIHLAESERSRVIGSLDNVEPSATWLVQNRAFCIADRGVDELVDTVFFDLHSHHQNVHHNSKTTGLPGGSCLI